MTSKDEDVTDRRTGVDPARDRRDYTPPGRLRRLLHDHRTGVAGLTAAAVILLILCAATTAFAVNERFKRDVAEIAYSRDARSLQFLLEQEAASLRKMGDTIAALENRVEEMQPENQPYLVVSLAERRVWYLNGTDTLFTAPVAVGSGKTIVMGGKTQRFQTPRGRMRITEKELDPVWVPPDWHY